MVLLMPRTPESAEVFPTVACSSLSVMDVQAASIVMEDWLSKRGRRLNRWIERRVILTTKGELRSFAESAPAKSKVRVPLAPSHLLTLHCSKSEKVRGPVQPLREFALSPSFRLLSPPLALPLLTLSHPSRPLPLAAHAHTRPANHC